MTTPALEIFARPDALGEALAGRILAAAAEAGAAGRPFLLGCPGGRSPRPVYQAMAAALAAAPRDLGHVVIVMMDDYLAERDGRLDHVDADAHYSCRRFGREEILAVLNAGLPEPWRIPAANLWVPDPADPAAYDRRIAAAGGIDLFILASGASDGHVAFNPAGTPADTRTRIVPLAEATRRDNMQTFPDFASLAEVPAHGISVGVGTIAEQSRAAAMVLWGEGKRLAFQRIAAADGYDPQWPASVVNLCRNATIFADAAAAGRTGPR
ncbi:6-phosphogluconolactonase [Labrys wisconsinensis]|uniref:Glucosamine-6-phosphate deaminase n=1 Tax=Labrys wisconsinensis TaxID=425677 RepID=A0ABU0J0X1_9HYPH|nr:6-phosphogluconolactonase [Labrys wisconsinensis]MDQ0467899.1 glucosamine-6-phosphate deaminase [Labrys wisconsinensis]